LDVGALTISGRTVRTEEFMDPQLVFEMLDGPDLFVSGRRWRVEVFSVSDHADYRWVQVGLDAPDDHHMLTLRLESGAGPQSALSALSSWLHDPEKRPSEVLNVA
jgi:hypothetical protein